MHSHGLAPLAKSRSKQFLLCSHQAMLIYSQLYSPPNGIPLKALSVISMEGSDSVPRRT